MDDKDKLQDSTLIAVIKGYRKDAIGPTNAQVTQDRVEAFDHYYGRPYGNEEEDSSSVVTRDLAETVDWVMPALMRMYLQSGDLGEFDPVSEDDEELARQQTDYTNYVIMKKNSGFMIIHDTAKDALLLKNGYCKHWFEEGEDVYYRDFADISDDELTLLFAKFEKTYSNVEVEHQEVIRDGKTVDDDFEPTEEDLASGAVKYNVRLKLYRKYKEIKLAATPPEELLIDINCRGSLQDADFVEHIPRMTRSDLVEMGMDKEWVYKLPGKGTDQVGSDSESNNAESDARDSVPEQSNRVGLPVDDRSMEEVDYHETYVRVDYDRDGIAELRKIVNVSDLIPPGDEWNTPVDTIPFTGGVIKRIPHRHLGESLDDDMGDLQLIHTTLLRQMLDNIYYTNHIQLAASNRVNEIDLYENAPGGIKRVDAETASGHIVPIPVQPIVDKIIPAIDHIKQMKDTRTGINEMTTGGNPDMLRETTKGAFMESLSRASQKVEMIGRMFAETFIKELMLRVHELIVKHIDEKQYVKLRGTYVEIDPLEWIDRDDLTVKVGLGTGTGEEQARVLSLLMGLQEKLYEMGLVGPEEAYAMFIDIASSLGQVNPDKYIIDPADDAFKQNKLFIMAKAMQQQSQGNPLAEAEKIKAEAKLRSDTEANQAKMAMKQLELQSQENMQRMKQELDVFLEGIRTQSKETIEAAKLEVQSMIEGIKLDLGKPGIGAGLQNDR